MKHLSNPANLWSKAGVIALCCGACATAQASLNISDLNTGAGDYGINTGGPIIDSHWGVSLIPPLPSTPPPGGTPTGSAYLVPNNIGFPFGYWLPNSSASSWITYSYPTQVGGDNSGAIFQYQLNFTVDAGGNVNISYTSDNDGTFKIINNSTSSSVSQAIGSTSYGTFQTTSYSFIAGDSYTIDFDVLNDPQGSGNPTGINVQFSGDGVTVSPVPEPATIVAGALLLLPLGASMLRGFRKNRIA